MKQIEFLGYVKKERGRREYNIHEAYARQKKGGKTACN